MIVRKLDFSTPGGKPAYIEYKVKGDPNFIRIPGSQPFATSPVSVSLLEGTYYDFRFSTFCGPDPTDISPWEYLLNQFSGYPCQAPSRLSLEIKESTPTFFNDYLIFTWGDNKNLVNIVGLTYQLRIFNSAHTQMGLTHTGNYVDSTVTITGEYGMYEPDTYTAIFTVICPSGSRPTISTTFTKKPNTCPQVENISYIENIVEDDTNAFNTFDFTWDDSAFAVNGFSWEIRDITRNSGWPLVTSGTTSVGVHSLNDVSLRKGYTYRIIITTLCKNNNAQPNTLDFEAHLPNCLLSVVDSPPNPVPLLELIFYTPIYSINRIPNPPTDFPKMNIYIMFTYQSTYSGSGTRSVQFSDRLVGTITGPCLPINTTRQINGTDGSIWKIHSDGTITLSSPQYKNLVKGQTYTLILSTSIELR